MSNTSQSVGESQETTQTTESQGNTSQEPAAQPAQSAPVQPIDLASIQPPSESTPIIQTDNQTTDDVDEQSNEPVTPIQNTAAFSEMIMQENHFDQELENQMEIINERLQKMADRIANLQKSVITVSQKLNVIECV